MNDRLGRHPAAILLATWGGCGYVPKAPGTAASVVAAAMAYCVVEGLGLAPAWFLLAAALLWFPGAWSAGLAAEHFGRHDPSEVVVDEAVGQWIAVAAVAPGEWLSWLTALVLFRVFDITTPWPIRKLEALPGGTGVVADDAAAGLCAMIVLVGLHYFSLV